ncbi:amino acid deaminase [Pseudoduganella sp. RAF53_2]|uniref:amino acid deaminase n=1 Tax=unclassified Pseudoduganella TaxID=2637179 RepID=UPI003F990F1D
MNTLPDGGLALAALDDQVLQPGTKGLPIIEPLRQHMIGLQNWNILNADTGFPVAVLKQSALQHNLQWMRAFCDQYGVMLAPHGKTTMSPQLFGAQLGNGAWGITLATAYQVQIAARFGVRRVIMANELVAPADIKAVLQLMRDDAGFEFYALVDSIEGVERLSKAVQASGLPRPLPLLVELGMQGKRAGVRAAEDVLAVARAVSQAPGLQLAGMEGYEGLASDTQAVNEFLQKMVALLRQADEEKLFGGEQIIISAGGSAFFDLVARGIRKLDASKPVLPVLRSGCYLTNDHGTYEEAIREIGKREGKTQGGLQPALEVWSVVLSRPEPNLAILSMGKRDASHDIGLPRALYQHRPGARAEASALPPGCEIVKMNDQHAYLRWPEGTSPDLKVGDLVGCGISHPCTTFDKWQLMLVVDDQYNVQHAINTFF